MTDYATPEQPLAILFSDTKCESPQRVLGSVDQWTVEVKFLEVSISLGKDQRYQVHARWTFRWDQQLCMWLCELDESDVEVLSDWSESLDQNSREFIQIFGVLKGFYRPGPFDLGELRRQAILGEIGKHQQKINELRYRLDPDEKVSTTK